MPKVQRLRVEISKFHEALTVFIGYQYRPIRGFDDHIRPIGKRDFKPTLSSSILKTTSIWTVSKTAFPVFTKVFDEIAPSVATYKYRVFSGKNTFQWEKKQRKHRQLLLAFWNKNRKNNIIEILNQLKIDYTGCSITLYHGVHLVTMNNALCTVIYAQKEAVHRTSSNPNQIFSSTVFQVWNHGDALSPVLTKKTFTKLCIKWMLPKCDNTKNTSYYSSK